MASLSDIANVVISTQTAAIKQASFDLPLIADYHTVFPERVRHYNDLDGMVDDGFAVTDAAYQAAAAMLAQNPNIAEFCIGRRALAPTIRVDLTPTLAIGKTYSVVVQKPDGTESTVSYECTTDRSLAYDGQSANFTPGDVLTGSISGATGTIVSVDDSGATGTIRLSNVVGAFVNNDALTDEHAGNGDATGADTAYETVATIVAGLQSAIDALAGVAASNQTTYVRVTASTAGDYFALIVDNKAILSAKQTHADPGIATDLAAIALEDDTWYGLTLSTQGAAEIDEASEWAESNEKFFVQATQDGDCIVAGSGDVMSTIKTANRNRTATIFSSDPTQHAGAAWMGAAFPIDPGGLTFANMTLAGVNTEELTPSNIAQLKAKNGNYMVAYGGVALTRNGVMASGEYMDIIRDRDWYRNQLQTAVLDVMVNNDKVPFTDAGIAKLETAVRAATKRAIDAGFLAEGSDSYVVPLASEVSPTDRANRTLGSTPIKVNARVAGAIHVAEIRATITA